MTDTSHIERVKYQLEEWKLQKKQEAYEKWSKDGVEFDIDDYRMCLKLIDEIVTPNAALGEIGGK